MAIKAAFDKFMSTEFQGAVDKSTRASWGGGGYSVELFPDGEYRVLWNNQIGNRYDSQGLILSIPTLDDSEWDEEDPTLRYYDDAETAMRSSFEEAEELLATFPQGH